MARGTVKGATQTSAKYASCCCDVRASSSVQLIAWRIIMICAWCKCVYMVWDINMMYGTHDVLKCMDHSRVCVSLSLWMRVCACVSTRVCVSLSVYECMCVYVSVCLCACLHVSCLYENTHTKTHHIFGMNASKVWEGRRWISTRLCIRAEVWARVFENMLAWSWYEREVVCVDVRTWKRTYWLMIPGTVLAQWCRDSNCFHPAKSYSLLRCPPFSNSAT